MIKIYSFNLAKMTLFQNRNPIIFCIKKIQSNQTKCLHSFCAILSNCYMNITLSLVSTRWPEPGWLRSIWPPSDWSDTTPLTDRSAWKWIPTPVQFARKRRSPCNGCKLPKTLVRAMWCCQHFWFYLERIKHFISSNSGLWRHHLRFGTTAIAKPLPTSKPPTTRRYHFDATLKLSKSDNGNTFEYFTYSFRCNKKKHKL